MSADSIANRDDPLPVIRIPLRDDEAATHATTSDQEHGTKEKILEQANKLKETLGRYGAPENRQSLQDRLFAGIMSQLIPPEELSDDEDKDSNGTREVKPDRRSRTYVDRPGFSIQSMSANFRRFNARCGPVFVLQNRLIHLFTWRHPTATLSFLAVYTLLCLKPHLLPVVPLVGILFSIMIPSFLARHPAPVNDPRVEPSYIGPPVAPPSRVKPAPEMSRDFFRNMRDLQNSMEDFSRLHDTANEYVTPYVNFSDEGVSSMLFVGLFTLSCAAFIGSQLILWRAVALLSGWIAVAAGHPEAQTTLLSPKILSNLRQRLDHLQIQLRNYIEVDISLGGPPETRQVEIFELQKYHAYSDTWEAWLFSPSPYDPLSPARIGGARAKGTQFFEEVESPSGWSWKDKKWSLDLSSREWVEQRMITGVEIETEGERWVYDIPTEEADLTGTLSSKGKKGKKAKELPKSGWEESSGLDKRGEWRRRRWVRLVERKGHVKTESRPG